MEGEGGGIKQLGAACQTPGNRVFNVQFGASMLELAVCRVSSMRR